MITATHFNCGTMTASNADSQSVWERLEQGRKLKAAQGRYAGYGSPAFGQQAIEGELVENATEAEVIELIRRHHKSGKSLQQIADWLNQHGYLTKRSRQWQRISVKRVLDRLYGRSSRQSTQSTQPQQQVPLKIQQQTHDSVS